MIIYSKDGLTQICEVKKFTYNGTFLEQSYITTTITSEVPIQFSVGDYCEYRGERFELNYIPSKEKVSSTNTYGEGYIYEDVKFLFLGAELSNCSFLDYVVGNVITHYSGLPTFSFYGTVNQLADRIQANLDRLYKKTLSGTASCSSSSGIVTGVGTSFTSLSVGDRIRIGDNYRIILSIESNTQLTVTIPFTNTYSNVSITHLLWNISVNDSFVGADLNITATNITCWDALKFAYSSFGANYTISGRNVIIGADAISVGSTFGYKNGIKSLRLVPYLDSSVITRLKVYGSTRNIPYRWYNKQINPSTSLPYIPDSMYVSNLMLPSFLENGGDAYIDDAAAIQEYGIKEDSVFFDGSDENLEEIYPSIEGMTYAQLVAAGIAITKPVGDNGNLDEIYSAVNPADDGILPDDGTSLPSTFTITLKDLGFDLSAKVGDNYLYATTSGEMTVSVNSGNCVGYSFSIINIVKHVVSGVITYELTCNRYSDDEIGMAFPNSSYQLLSGDKFVLVNIQMPDVYIFAAMQRLLQDGTSFLDNRKYQKSTYEFDVDNIYMAKNPLTSIKIKEGNTFDFSDTDFDISESVIIKNVEIKEDESLIPQYSVTLSNEYEDTGIGNIRSEISKIKVSVPSETQTTNWDLSSAYAHYHGNKSLIDLINQTNIDVLGHLSVIDGKIQSDIDFYSIGEVSAFGAGSGSGGSGLIQTVYGLSGLGGTYSDATLTDTFNAYAINSLHNRINSLEAGSALNFTTSGSGNAVTSVVKSGTSVNVTKGLTFSVDGHVHNFADITNKPSTLGGYGITDALLASSYTANDVLTKLKTVDGAGSGLDADTLDGMHLKSIIGSDTKRDFINGTLITTDIDYSCTNGAPFYLEIKGNAYGRVYPCLTQAQGYIYSNTIVNYGVTHLGYAAIVGLVALNVNGRLCFWFPRQTYWEGYSIFVSDASSTSYNRVIAIDDVAKPAGTKEVIISEHTATSAFTTDNVESANKLKTARTIAGVSFDGTDNIAIPFANLSSIPTTLSGYGITDAYTKTQTDGLLALKLDIATFSDLFEKVNIGTTASPVYAIKAKYNFYSIGEVSAFGAGSSSNPNGGLIQTVYGYAGLGSTYSDATLTNTFNAYTINRINTDLSARISSLESGSAISFTTVGSGNAVTSVTKSGTSVTVTKGLTFSVDGHTHSYLPLSGGTLTGNLTAPTFIGALTGNASTATQVLAAVTGTNNAELVKGYMADNDMFRILVGGTDTNAGFAEIATADDGTEPIYVRQYTGPFTSLVRTLTLLDSSGNSSFPGSITAANYLRADGATIWHSGNDGAGSGLDADTLDGIHNGRLTAKVVGGIANYNTPTHRAMTIGEVKTLLKNTLGAEGTMSNAVISSSVVNNWSNESSIGYDSSIHNVIRLDGYGNSPYGQYLFSYYDTNQLLVAGVNNGVWSELKALAFTTDNVASATKLQTSRTIWGQSFDGTGNVSGDLGMGGYTISGTAGKIFFGGNFHIDSIGTNDLLLNFYNNTNIYMNYGESQGNTIFGGNVGIGGVDSNYKLNVVGSLRTTGAVTFDNTLFVGSDLYVGSGSNSKTIAVRNIQGYDATDLSLNPWGGNVSIGSTDANGYKLNVNGTLRTTGAITAPRISVGYDNATYAISTSGLISNGWLRTTGSVGWYSESYGGGINMTDSTYVRVHNNKAFWVNNNIVATGEITAFGASDIRLKDNVKPISSALDFLGKVKTYEFDWNEKAIELNPLKTKKGAGVIAQELQNLDSDFVHSIYGEYLGVDYDRFIPYLIGGVNEVADEVTILKKRVAELELEVKNIKNANNIL